jgi:hypothetical protein
MATQTTQPGDTFYSLAAQIFPGKDVTRFTELLDLNPDLDPFSDLPAGIPITLPSQQQILQMAQPALGQIATAAGSLATGSALTTSIPTTDTLATSFQGYAPEAVNLVGAVNGATEAESIISQTSTDLGESQQQLVQLTTWLLSGKR